MLDVVLGIFIYKLIILIARIVLKCVLGKLEVHADDDTMKEIKDEAARFRAWLDK